MPSVDLLVVTTASSLTAGIKRIHLIQRLVSCEMLFYLEDAPLSYNKGSPSGNGAVRPKNEEFCIKYYIISTARVT